MNELENIRTFVTVLESGSVTEAANRIGITKSVVSRRLKTLEAELGARLLTRTPHGITPTPAGLDYYEKVKNILSQLADANSSLRATEQTLTGVIRLAAPKSFGRLFIHPAVIDIMTQHPGLILEVSFSDRLVDIAREGFDLGLRIGILQDSSLIARKLASIRHVMVASPDYLKAHGAPLTPHDLKDHDCILYSNARDAHHWTFLRNGQKVTVPVRGRLKTNSGDLEAQAAEAGLGILRIPYFFVKHQLEQGRLVEILQDWPTETMGLYAVYPETRLLSTRVRHLIDILAAYFAREDIRANL
ncbi:LysR family transcriptional regulator [Luteithermobacter gelatinilyticus]|uniref:LysR family transcriptional regulator n=1 Tax=Luteithermobacter gelatinilyticus TaxID=2582913 RepID=UPI00143D1ED2|nr:LysR family transcriptional regulator [Luteithermobacter gelatinilyticus]|tara:strand:- start:101 stop:1006 length:906 start_codon:yes stop_codon:yes gene_type:complete